MANLFHIARAHAPCAACDTITELTRDIDDLLRRTATKRPTLVCCWHRDGDDRPSCHWDIAVPESAI